MAKQARRAAGEQCAKGVRIDRAAVFAPLLALVGPHLVRARLGLRLRLGLAEVRVRVGYS